MAARLEPNAVAKVADHLGQAMANTTNQFAVGKLAAGLAAVAARLEPATAAKAADRLSQALANTKDAFASPTLAAALVAVAAQLEPKVTADRLIKPWAAQQISAQMHQLAVGLAAVLGKVDAASAAKIGDYVAQAIGNTRDGYVQRGTSGGSGTARACRRGKSIRPPCTGHDQHDRRT